MSDQPGEQDHDSAARERLRRALDRVDLDPQQTADDVGPTQNQDQRLRDEVPPHHGSH